MIINERELFGGGISIKVPIDFLDVSDFRQVPDNQEVFVSKDTDANLIVELLETPSDLSESDMGIKYQELIKQRYHWNELCNDNGSIDSIIEKTGNMDMSEFKNVSFVIGIQSIPKYGKIKDLTKVKIRLLCLRIPSIKSDILISLSCSNDLEIFTDDNFVEICKSFHILDWHLFK